MKWMRTSVTLLLALAALAIWLAAPPRRRTPSRSDSSRHHRPSRRGRRQRQAGGRIGRQGSERGRWNHGRKVDLIVYDDRFSPQESVAIANKLIEKDQVVGVVSGSYSGPTRVAAPIYAKAGVPMVAGYAVHPDVTKSGESNFRQGFLGEVEGRAAESTRSRS